MRYKIDVKVVFLCYNRKKVTWISKLAEKGRNFKDVNMGIKFHTSALLSHNLFSNVALFAFQTKNNKGCYHDASFILLVYTPCGWS